MAITIFMTMQLLPQDQFRSWGWRVPFLLSGLLVAIGVYTRIKLCESPQFTKILLQDQAAKIPALDLFKKFPVKLLGLIFIHQTSALWLYGTTVFGFAYLTNTLQMPQDLITQAWLVALVLSLMTIPLFAWIGDNVTRLTMYRAQGILAILLAGPMIVLLINAQVIVFAAVGVAIMMAMSWSNAATFYTEQFPVKYRQSGAGLCVNLGALVGGGLFPILIAWLTNNFGISSFGWVLAMGGFISFMCTFLIKKVSDDE